MSILPALRLTTGEVCQIARISRATLWRRIKSGGLPLPIDRGRQALFDRAQVLRALHAPGQESASVLDLDAALARRWADLRNRPRG